MATDEIAHPGSVFRLQFSYVHDSQFDPGQIGGNLIKSRAERNEIYASWIEGGYYHELELIGPDPSGGAGTAAREDSDVVGNVFVKQGLICEEMLQRALAIQKRTGQKIGEILTGMGLTVCGYCGGAIVSENLMGRKRQADGKPWPGHRRLACAASANGRGCGVGGSIEVVRALALQGHRIATNVGGFGGYQGIWIDAERGVLIGGTESRKDGIALG